MDRVPHKLCKAIHAPDWMIIDAVRYALGRRSYQAGVTASWVRGLWDKLTQHTQEIIKRDIEGEFETCERTGHYSDFGDECDLREWKSVRSLWKIQPKEKP